MKRLICMALACGMLLSGCTLSTSSDAGTYQFYYQSVASANNIIASSVLASEKRKADLSEDTPIQDLVALYLEGPKSDKLLSPFPKDTIVLSCLNYNGDVTLELGGSYRNMDGVAKTIAQACLVNTISQLDGVQTVTVRNDGGTLANVDSRALSGGDFILVDSESESRQISVRVYFPDMENRYLLSTTFRILSDSAETTATAVIQQLIAGPSNVGMNAVMPQGTALRNLWINNGVCTVDFTMPFLSGRPHTAAQERILLYSIVNSLCELPEIDSVRFFCEGEKIGTYCQTDLSSPLLPFDGIIGPVREAAGEIDASVYMITPDQGHISGFPTRVRPSTGESKAEALLRTMFEFDPPEGYRNPIPKQTSVNFCSIDENGTCHLDLSEGLLLGNSSTDTLLSVRALVTTLCTLDEVTGVEVTVNGSNDVLKLCAIDTPAVVDPDWTFE